MDDLDYIIQYEEEATNLDFKREEYRKEQNAELIKDVMAMANALNDNTKRIIIGVEKTSEDRALIGIDDVSDPAIIENLIQENVEPTINLKYYSYKLVGKTFAILELTNNSDRPYMMRKDYGKNLSKGEIWIRRGTRKSRAVRRDIDMMYQLKAQKVSTSDIELGYTDGLDKTITLMVSPIDEKEFPSTKEKNRLQNKLKQLEDRYYNSQEEAKPIEKRATSIERFAQQMSLIKGFDDANKRIKIGNDYLGMPIYKSKDEIVQDINHIEESYADWDNYYLFEQIAYHLNFYIRNNGSEFLENARITMHFDSDYFMIASKIYDKPEQHNPFDVQAAKLLYDDYPTVVEQDNSTLVETYKSEIRHKDIVKVFDEDLRVLVFPNKEKMETDINYSISAKNIPCLIDGVIHVVIEEKNI